MPDLNDVKEALSQIKAICASHQYCEGCVFRQGRGGCEFALMGADKDNLLPSEWTLSWEEE